MVTVIHVISRISLVGENHIIPVPFGMSKTKKSLIYDVERESE